MTVLDQILGKSLESAKYSGKQRKKCKPFKRTLGAGKKVSVVNEVYESCVADFNAYCFYFLKLNFDIYSRISQHNQTLFSLRPENHIDTYSAMLLVM